MIPFILLYLAIIALILFCGFDASIIRKKQKSKHCPFCGAEKSVVRNEDNLHHCFACGRSFWPGGAVFYESMPEKKRKNHE